VNKSLFYTVQTGVSGFAFGAGQALKNNLSTGIWFHSLRSQCSVITVKSIVQEVMAVRRIVDLASQDASDIGGHHHSEQRLVDAAAALQLRWEERPPP